MLASQEHFGKIEGPPTTSPTTPTSKPLLEITNTVMSTIGFVPRAIGSAVVDTFRSRNTRAAAAAAKETSTEQVTPKSAIASSSSSPMPAESDAEVRKLREKVAAMAAEDVPSLTLKELHLALHDYRQLLITKTN